MFKHYLLILLYHFLVSLHWFVFLGLILSIPLSIIYQPWYIALAVSTLVVRTATSPNVCPLSALECRVAKEIGYPEYKYFMKFHVIPVVKKINKQAAQLYLKYFYKY